MGGISAPPELAAASTPAAVTGLNPELFIRGIVNVPVVAVLATALPDREPMRPLLKTATLAGPPTLLRNKRRVTLMTYCVAPVCSSKVPNRTNRKTYRNITRSAIPNHTAILQE